ncbi:MAG: hypothetical protein Q9191_007596 [Dirinaria sp. TL-2023a]
MGVTGLWTVVQPCARPIKLETLNKKRLAVDASIWIYQFLKAVRDKEGNALRNSHIVGFFRRICKLLFFGIKPVFVFDGGAPLLKRQTVSSRKARREGRREDAVRTAGKLLAVQMQRRAEEEDIKRREEQGRPTVDPDEEEVPDNPVYVDELQMTAQERQQNRSFKKKDAYHLPELDVSLAEMGAPNDPRIMSQEELEEYARQFHTGEDINLYDFSKIDFNSPFFMSLPASDRYNILNAARLRSRLRMGYSKEQLDTMFPDRMAFSKFQIDRVKERNELTQRLMNINGMNGEDAMFGVNGPGRVAGEKGKEYVLVKNDGVEGGWALGVVSNKGEGERSRPIDVEQLDQDPASQQAEDEPEDEGFEDVPIEGLNRLPKRSKGASVVASAGEDILDRRRALYEARQQGAGKKPPVASPREDESESLFIPHEPEQAASDEEHENMDALFEDVIPFAAEDDEDEDLQRAITMSLESPTCDDGHDDVEVTGEYAYNGPSINEPLEFNQKNANVGRDFAHRFNAKAQYDFRNPEVSQAADGHSPVEPTEPLNGPRVFGLKKTRNESDLDVATSKEDIPAAKVSSPSRPTPKSGGFGGPLPFESLNLGKSIFAKSKKRQEVEAGGFEKNQETKNDAKPLPPWFSGDIRVESAAQKLFEEDQNKTPESSQEASNHVGHQTLKKQQTGEVIDLEAPKGSQEVIEVESSDDEAGDDMQMGDVVPIDSEVRMGDVADLTRVEPPSSGPFSSNFRPEATDLGKQLEVSKQSSHVASDSDEPLEWEESDHEDHSTRSDPKVSAEKPVGGSIKSRLSSSPSPEFEDVGPHVTSIPPSQPATPEATTFDPSNEPSLPNEGTFESAAPPDEDDIYSDPDEEDLMRQLATEAEEHARFSATLNPMSHLQSAEDYEKELRQLRNQQKKDRRDADEVSHIMVTECQQLLKLFGLPYVTAPMEAEAQCAELVSLGLVDGIVTDDSDVFLFGGTRVYKNMFNQAKFVECYLASDLEKEYSLTRPKLIDIAHLLGSDYTEGLPNVGPVTALEILSEFETLENFSSWWETVSLGQPATAEDRASPFRRKFRKNATKIFLPNGFPDKRVNHAYQHPEVDHDPSPFAWGVPDLDALRSFLMATIGWSQERTDEVLVPVVKDMNRRENEGTQANITQFFGGAVGVGATRTSEKEAYAPRRRIEKSQRMANALGRLHARARESTLDDGEVAEAADEGANGQRDAISPDGIAESGPSRKSRASKKRTAPVNASGSGSDEGSSQEYTASKKAKKGRKGTRAGRKSKP